MSVIVPEVARAPLRVDKNGATSNKYGFSVAAPDANGNSDNTDLTYNLATVTIDVGQPSYLLRLYNGLSGHSLGYGLDQC